MEMRVEISQVKEEEEAEISKLASVLSGQGFPDKSYSENALFLYFF